MIDLPTELLRTLVAFAETGSLGAAARRIGRSESAVSLQLKRLQGISGAMLFRRIGRGLLLTEAGWHLLGHARLILHHTDAAIVALKGGGSAGGARLGIVQDLVDPLLTGVLQQFKQVAPEAQLGVFVARSSELMQALGEGAVDVVLCVRGEGGPTPVYREVMQWFGDEIHLAKALLPLVLVSRPCPYWHAATQALDDCGRAFRIGLETPSLSGVRSGVAAGFGIGCRSRLFINGQFPVLTRAHGMPTLPEISYVVMRRPEAPLVARMLADIVETAARALE